MTADTKITMKISLTPEEINAINNTKALLDEIYNLGEHNEHVILVNEAEENIFGLNIVKNLITCLGQLQNKVNKETE